VENRAISSPFFLLISIRGFFFGQKDVNDLNAKNPEASGKERRGTQRIFNATFAFLSDCFALLAFCLFSLRIPKGLFGSNVIV
jgi:hypothetical protein